MCEEEQYCRGENCERLVCDACGKPLKGIVCQCSEQNPEQQLQRQRNSKGNGKLVKSSLLGIVTGAVAGELIDRQKSQQTMELHRKQIYIETHSHGYLNLRPAEQSNRCWGCQETVLAKQPCYHCDEPKCGFRIHEECAPTQSIWLGLVNCTFTFQQGPPRGKKMGCEACGKDVNGWCFVGVLRQRSCYLHPCCARLDFKRTVQDKGRGVVIDLKEKTSSVCLICGNEGHSKDFRSWVYVSRCGKYCYHVSCMKGSVEKWMRDGASSSRNQIPETGSSTSITSYLAGPTPNQHMRPHRGEKVFGYLEIAAEILNVVLSFAFGIPPLPFSLVLTCIRRMW